MDITGRLLIKLENLLRNYALKIEITTPFLYNAEDYHEFLHLQDLIKKLSKKYIRFKEIEDTAYSAVFYCQGESELADALVKSVFGKK